MYLILLLFFIVPGSLSAKLLNTFDQNRVQYGEPISVEEFSTAAGFTGYATYVVNTNWKIKAFFINNKVRSEHMLALNDPKLKFDRNQVRLEANKMFDPSHRGSYHKKLDYLRVEGHFFDKGLVAYEYLMNGNKLVGYNGIKVLLYEGDEAFYKINPKAYL